jgi:hypothetical protein
MFWFIKTRVVRRHLLLVFLFLSLSSAAQPAQVISFDELIARQVTKSHSWINPDTSREAIVITEMAIPLDKEMKDLTRKFMVDNYRRTSTWVEPRMIMIHSMDLGDLRNSLEQSSFLFRRMPSRWRTQIRAGTLPSGAHFIVDRDGTIYCLTPPSSMNEEDGISYNRDSHRWFIRRHFDANPMALGIENVTPNNGSYEDLTEEQVLANAKLVKWLMWMERDSITHVTSHHQFNDKEQFVSMLSEFSLELARTPYRAWTRKDVGDAVLRRILDEVKKSGWEVKERF